VLSPSCDGDDFFAASVLRDEIEERSSLELGIEKHGDVTGLAGRRTSARSVQPSGPQRPALETRPIILMRLSDAGRDGYPEPGGAGRADSIGEEGYVIESSPEALVLAANTSAGIFYGVHTLRQILALKPGRAWLEELSVTDWPTFRYRGVMHDISRGKVPTTETLFKLVEMLASVKVNVLQLYTEHTFAFRRHPEISRGASPLTAEDLMRLDEHARRHHIELQANLQSFGHMKRILSTKKLAHLAESSDAWSIAPGRPETYRFLDELYAEHLPCFSSPVFNADCDETWDLGKGRSRRRAEKVGLGRVYVDHIRRLHRLAKRRGKRLAVWGDIVLQHPEEIERLPKDVIMLNWGYGAKHDFSTSRRFAEAGLEHWVCPGTNSWCSLFPRVDVACANIAGFAREGGKTGASGLLNTDWGDGGHPNLLGTSLHGFALGAEAAWSGPQKTSSDFDRRFSWALFRNQSGLVGRIFRTLGGTNSVFGPRTYRSAPFRLYWAEFPYGEDLLGPTRSQLERCEREATRARSLLGSARQSEACDKLLLAELDFAARQTILACQKARVAREIVKAVPRAAGESAAGFGGRGLPESLVAQVVDVHREWKLQRDEFERLWCARARRSEIDIILRQYRDREQELARLAEPTTSTTGEL
jgi:hypothetical protein